MEALKQATVSYDLSPVTLPANNDEPPVEAVAKPAPRLWLEDWNEEDEARLRQSRAEDDNNWDWDSLINIG